jgi:hypothetical protein
MRILFGFIHLVWKLSRSVVVIFICLAMIFIAYKGNQPMSVQSAPKGMTYFEFMADRIDAAKMVKPSQCGWGMFLTLAMLGPTYSALYTEIGVHPGGFWDRVSAPDSNIPIGVAGAKWHDIPHIWWKVVEHLSWTMLGKQRGTGCQFRPVLAQH